ncbi:MAG: hypothetical protein Q8P44_05210 [Dehalococcoidia bacterium]|nr:hypothetical protein [Dehalococcoidia bacterium]
MGKHPFDDAIWRRGWNDTKSVWTSWQFFVLDAVVAVVIGGVFQWYWGLSLILFSMFCVWLGATGSAPIKQRNEARKRIAELEVEKEKRKAVHMIIGGIEHDICTGKILMEKLRHSKGLDEYLVKEYHLWYSLVGEFLQKDQYSEYFPWFSVAYTQPGATLEKIVNACEAGVNQLLDIHRRLTNSSTLDKEGSQTE